MHFKPPGKEVFSPVNTETPVIKGIQPTQSYALCCVKEELMAALS